MDQLTTSHKAIVVRKRETLVETLDEWIESRHCTLFGTSSDVSKPEDRRRVAESYADLFLNAFEHRAQIQA